ncbi:uncharacterized protein LOC123506639 [Portunus trituberculatus]|uniref:uncharacterized protein LOC123506639 n=1 Tax=Portunus trituberculatus TaxID=210409 RepID=UPI001E1CCBE8|nr:uncharacterized protein LOC123506639 [Portunus trituberculatus]
MRRMKIRAKPNFGGGGGGVSRTSSGPGRGSAAPVEAQTSKVQITPPPQEEADVSVKCLDGDVEQTSGTQNINSDVSSVTLQENTNKSPSNITTSMSSQVHATQLSLTSVQGVKSSDVTESGKEFQQVVTDNNSESSVAISSETEGSVTPKPPESHAIPIPKSQPQESPGATTFQIISQSITQTHVDKSVDVSCGAASPISDSNTNVSRDTHQDSDGKSTLCIRRKKLKVKPMLGSVRKGSVIDKAKVKASDSNTSAPNVKSECVDVQTSGNQTNTEENVSKPENAVNNQLNQNMQAKANIDADADHVSKMCNEKPSEKDVYSGTKATPESSEASEVLVCPTEKEVILVRQEVEIEDVLPERTCEDMEVEVVKENINTDVVVNENPPAVGNNAASKAISHTSAPATGCKRRPRICAKPTLITKKKKEDKGTVVKPTKQILATDEQPTNASPQESIARGSGSEESDAVVVKPNIDICETRQREECKSKPTIASFKKEVKFAEIELNKKHSHYSNISDSNKDRESEETQKMKKEGIHDNVKENVDNTFHSNLKTPRKKKLSENKEIDPELEVLDINTSVEKQGKNKLKQDKCEEVVNSDDSTGDKENASTAVTELPKQERLVKDNCSGIMQKAKTKSPVHSSKLYGKFERKLKFEEDGDSPDKKKNLIAP